jgi:hypothetical protein
MREIARSGWLIVAMFLSVTGVALSQAEQQDGTLVVSGHTGQAPVTHLNGRPYVAVDALARLMNGSLAYRGNEITLTLSDAAGEVANQPASRELSSKFMNAGIEAMSDIREWRSVLLSAVQNGSRAADLPMLIDPYKAQANKNLRLASVAATTASDRDVLQLLNRELGHMQQFSDKIVTARNRASYITVDSLMKDPLDQKILNCAHALGEIAASGEFHDNGSCH